MRDIPNVANQPRLPSNDNEARELKEFSILNRAIYLFRRQDQYMNEAEGIHHQTKTNQDLSGANLISCLSAIEHAWLQTKYAVDEKKRRKIVEKLNAANRDISAALEHNKMMAADDYTKIHAQLMDIIDAIFEANQSSNIGIPMDFKRDQGQKIREAFR